MTFSQPGLKIAQERIGMALSTLLRVQRQCLRVGDQESADELNRVQVSLLHLGHHVKDEVRPGRCRWCGCSEDHACMLGGDAPRPCEWANDSKTCCDNRDCKRREGAMRARQSRQKENRDAVIVTKPKP